MKKAIIASLAVVLFLTGCVSPESIATESKCTEAKFFWCDNDGDGTFACQKTDCTLGSLTGEVPETGVGLGTNETNLGALDTSAEGAGLGELGDIGSTLNPLEGVGTSAI